MLRRELLYGASQGTMRHLNGSVARHEQLFQNLFLTMKNSLSAYLTVPTLSCEAYGHSARIPRSRANLAPNVNRRYEASLSSCDGAGPDMAAFTATRKRPWHISARLGENAHSSAPRTPTRLRVASVMARVRARELWIEGTASRRLSSPSNGVSVGP